MYVYFDIDLPEDYAACVTKGKRYAFRAHFQDGAMGIIKDDYGYEISIVLDISPDNFHNCSHLAMLGKWKIDTDFNKNSNYVIQIEATCSKRLLCKRICVSADSVSEATIKAIGITRPSAEEVAKTAKLDHEKIIYAVAHVHVADDLESKMWYVH